MNRGFILMTALPASVGHVELVSWASGFGIDQLYVMVCGRKEDPLPLFDRVSAMMQEFNGSWGIRISALEHDLPDYPEQFNGTVEEFDQQWVNKINEHLSSEYDEEDYPFEPLDAGDFLFASDIYGARFAKNLGIGFAPFDPNREVVQISGTKIRREPFKNFKYITPYLRERMQQVITIFGAESTGKSTITRKLAEKYDSPYTFEWARPYLESLPTPEVTDERMRMIVRGQAALQHSVRKHNESPFIFQDTDLYSTLGYYNLYKGGTSEDIENCLYATSDFVCDLYIVMNSDIRFTPDPLRYGITQRESSDQYWIDLLEEHNLNYYVVKSTNPHAQEDEISKVIEKNFLDANPVFGFERV